ncbi:16S rRNA (cytosine967-C5)-methyltransferase [Parasphingorhabdus marina DSM 22363]|uniref:16S rRNA (Cytosine967-C5)-methyltransferase n=1 Tax=Parasphingorhabdus marina DSM 22363 TaxID=1123272 RepID=A0A1N6CSE4_9SPHN|nr:RsmB/NOP family class I SAM-dependent RNA methyltransferase [Parasphingorhabdus marina]SIN61407.1 16S rRNA (cytosine967-C5)-methyltransferase [Parasphingorhabdus marina DSM 22363]
MNNSRPDRKVPGLPARQAALRLLDAVCRRGETLDQAMPAATGRLSNPSDKALAHNIAANVLRWMTALDAMIDSATRNRLADDAKARMALRIALAQVLILETPQHAAIATALPLVHGGPRRLVHGVFSTVMRGIDNGKLKIPEYPEIPGETLDRWTHNWGEDTAAAACRAWAVPPPVDLSFREEQTAPALQGLSLASRHLRLTDPAPVTELPGFAEGDFWVQDLAASLPARLLGHGEGRTVLDLCAAPGGKSMQLAASGWRVVSVDSSEKRMIRYHENMTRTGLESETVIADLMRWESPELADAVLLDAPCSATGIFRRHPDVLHCIGARQIADRAEVQTGLLRRAAAWVKPGGLLVYAVCSLEPEEGEDQVTEFLAENSDYVIDPVASSELPEGIAPTADGTVRTLPGMLEEQGTLDGFFIARMRRKS